MHLYLYDRFRQLCLGIFIVLATISNAFAADLVYLNSTEGKQRLLMSQWHDTYFQMSAYVDTQENQGFCGIASIAASLNSLQIVKKPFSATYWPYKYFTQDNLFTTSSSKIKAKPVVSAAGLTLDQMQLFLKALDIRSTTYFGNDLTEDALRNLLKKTLKHQNDRIIVDFSRQTLNQEGHGHFSPIAAYDAHSDSVLILDVAKFKYPPFWVKVSDLLVSIQTLDTDSGKSRGLLVIHGDVN